MKDKDVLRNEYRYKVILDALKYLFHHTDYAIEVQWDRWYDRQTRRLNGESLPFDHWDNTFMDPTPEMLQEWDDITRKRRDESLIG